MNKKGNKKPNIFIKITAGLLAVVVASPVNTAVSAADEFILNDKVKNIYAGSVEGRAAITNLSYADMPAPPDESEAVARVGALGFMRGAVADGKRLFRPYDPVTQGEAIEFVLRAAGLEKQAVALAAQLAATAADKQTIDQTRMVAYVSLAVSSGLLTQNDLGRAYNTDLADLPENAFNIYRSVTREQFAQWLYTALTNVQKGFFDTSRTEEAINVLDDKNDIAADKAVAIDALLLNGVMSADLLGRFNPKGELTRADAAAAFSNADKIYMPVYGWSKKNGSVGAIKDEQADENGRSYINRNVFIRTANGSVEVIQYKAEQVAKGLIIEKNAPIYKNGKAAGLETLAVGDNIEYISDDATKTLLYADVSKKIESKTVTGLLNYVDSTNFKIQLVDLTTGKTFTFNTAERLFEPKNGTESLLVDGKAQSVATLPFGAKVILGLSDNVVTSVQYVGDPVMFTEVKGMVIDNDVDFGILTILDGKGNVLEREYYEDEMKVRKVAEYDLDGELNYLLEIFPHFKYDKFETTIADIEPGDVVYLRFDPDDPLVILGVSAATNYTLRYGKVRQVKAYDEGYASMLVEYENGQTAWFDYPDGVFVTKNGKPVAASALMAGDWVKMLVNEAVVSGGVLLETVKEFIIEGAGHTITSVVRGSLAGLDAVQMQISVGNSAELTKTGWGNSKNLAKYNISNKDIEYYDGGKRISLDYAVKYFKRSTDIVYIALENTYAGVKVRKVTFRRGRDQLLEADTVNGVDGDGGFTILAANGTISTDSGTIVRRYGRLVSGRDVMPWDYAVVSLNGEGKAAVVDVKDEPTVAGLEIHRARVVTVKDGESFVVQSLSRLTQPSVNWVYSPIPRTYELDSETRFIRSDGSVSGADSFIGYTEESVSGNVYTLIVDGGRVSYILETPYWINAVRGEVYEAADGIVKIKNAAWYDSETGKWSPVSEVNNTIQAAMAMCNVVGKDNKIVTVNSLVKGDYVVIYTDALPDEKVAGMAVVGNAVFVTK